MLVSFQIDAQHADQLRNQQLILYETLLRSTQAQTLLSHQPFIRPLLDLLNQFDNGGGGSGKNHSPRTLSSSTETEFHLVVLLNQACDQATFSMLFNAIYRVTHQVAQNLPLTMM